MATARQESLAHLRVQLHGPSGEFHFELQRLTPSQILHYPDASGRVYDLAGVQDGAAHYKERQ